MSEKIKSKDLSYDSSLPPFLQRLHAKNSGRGDADRHERQLARPKKSKDTNEDDGPTVIDESGETVSREDFEKLTSVKDTENVKGETDTNAEPKASGALPADAELGAKRTDSNVTNGVSQKKRKAAKVIGEDEAADNKTNDEKSASKPVKKAKKKAKVKLNFGDDEDP